MYTVLGKETSYGFNLRQDERDFYVGTYCSILLNRKSKKLIRRNGHSDELKPYNLKMVVYRNTGAKAQKG
jgi:hypothetical protein